MGCADLHIHSRYSWDGVAPVASILAYAAQVAQLNVIAITDHNQIDGALEAMQLAPAYGIEVIPGCEVSTAEGHLLALFVTRRIPAGLSLMDTVRAVGDLGGYCVAPHPMAGRASDSLSAQAIRAALQQPDLRRILIGIEAYNAGNVGWLFKDGNPQAAQLGRELGLAALGASDAHMLAAIGQGKASFPGQSAADLRQALIQRQTAALQGAALKTAQVLGGWAAGVLIHSIGWTRLAGLFGLL